MKILHISYGSPMIELCNALRSKGIDATSCHFDAHPFKFKPDICLNLQRLSVEKRAEKIEQFFQKAINKYDLFHFHFGETFFPDKRDLEILHRAGKKMVVHHHGSDIRKLSVARRNNPYVVVKPEWTEEKINNNLDMLSKYIDHAIVQDYELEAYIRDEYKYVHVIPHAIDPAQFKPNYSILKSSPPLVVHIPSSRNMKGTEYVLAAVEELKRTGLSFQFKLMEGLSNEAVKRMFANADIVIDQLRIGASGYVSSEAMALGKPVICFIREDLVSKYPGLPIVNANPDNLSTVLKDLIQHPSGWRKLGAQGRDYIKQNHSTSKVANKYLEIYNQL